MENLIAPKIPAKPVWIAARGGSMAPLWRDGARLLVVPTHPARLTIGELVVFESDGQLIAHRLIRWRRTGAGRQFQPMADRSSLAEPWQPEAALRGRIIQVEQDGRRRLLGRGPARWQQRLIGWRQRCRADLCAWWLRHTGRRRLDAALLSDQPMAPDQQRMAWARQAVLKARLEDCVARLQQLQAPVMLLKGAALLAQDAPGAAAREMSDLDLMVPLDDAPRVRQELLAEGFSPSGPQSLSRAPLDDQVLLEHPQGGLIDLHWRLITGGWRFRDVIRVEDNGLWVRARRVAVGGSCAYLLAPEDQWLHFCLHLILSGGTGVKWWRDVARMVEARAAHWPTVIARAGQWRARTIVWLVLDTLWQRWRMPVPVAAVQALRPAWWRRWALRALLPEDLTQADVAEPRWRRHLRELLLMDRARDRARLLWRWSRPPGAWHALRRSGCTPSEPSSILMSTPPT